MSERQEFLASVPLFSALPPDDLAIVVELAEPVEWKAGETVYDTGEPGDALYAVETGAVEIYGIVGGVEKPFTTVRSGGSFGLLSLIDRGERPVSARAEEPTRAVRIARSDLYELFESRPEIGMKVLSGVGATLGRQVRLMVDQFKDALAWNLEVTGLAHFNLERVMTERVEVLVETLRGEPLRGTLFRFEASSAGHELYLAAADGAIHVVPYHAIVRISADRDDIGQAAGDHAFEGLE